MAQRFGTMAGALAFALALTLATAPGPVRASSAATARTVVERHVNIAIEWDPTTPVNEREIWMAYLFTRAAHVARESEHEQLPLGERAASFDEEVRARRVAVNMFRQLARAHPALSSVYFSDLDRVDAAGFLREYVWRYLKGASWTAEPGSLRLAAFDTWRRTHLRNHVPETHGGIALRLAAN
ncbi:MAG TPA: hypothetical protein VMU67_17730 [Steroidobacteraceae bacterium]|nr:hypothetical protein [Steroidobacteraceae bacterium]